MKYIFCVFLLFISSAYADTPPPGTVKAKTFSGDGNTSIGATGSSLNSNITNSSLPVTGTFWQTTQPVSGTFWQTTQPVSGPLTDTQLRASAVPVTGTITTSNIANGTPGSAAPSQATQVGGSDGTNLRSFKVSNTGVLSVDGSASTQPISAASLPLPVGAATSGLQSSILTALGSPFQSGGSIGNSSFGISGTLPAFAATPTFNLGTLNGAATATLQSSTISVLGSPFQSGGSIANTAFGISGTLPAFATTPTFNLGTLNGAATAANQATEISSLATIATNTTNAGTPVVSGTVTVTQGTAASLNATVVTTAGATVAKDSSLTTINTTLGTPFQAGGSIGNSSFGISGTLPAYAATPTFNLGTLNGAATATLQTTGNSSLTTINTTLGSPFQVGGSIGNTSFIATQATGTNLHTVVDSGNVVVTSKTPTALTIHQAAITIGTTAVRLTFNGSTPASTRVLLVAQLLSTSTANCYFGSSTVTSTSTTRGVQMFPGQVFSLSNDAADYFAICDTVTQTFFVTEQE